MAEVQRSTPFARVDGDQTDVVFGQIEAVVARVVRSRVRDGAAADDLIQETMARFLARPVDDVREPEQYAATIALNLVRRRWADAARDRSVLPKVIDLREPADPHDLAVDADVAQALQAALGDLDPERRAALVAHDVAGVPTADLAGTDSSPGAVAASLARTRAKLRVAFLLRYRRIDLPTPACRTVLEAISANDGRRRARLGAEQHLSGCAVCRDLEPVLRERGVGWLGLSPGLPELLRRREVQVGAAVAVATAVAVVAIVRSGDADVPRPPVEASADVAGTPPPVELAEPPPPSPPVDPLASVTVPSVDPAGSSPVPMRDAPDQPAVVRSDPASAAGPPPRNVSSPPADVEAPTVHLPVDVPLIERDLVLEHPLVEPLEPIVCPVLDLPVPLASCRSEEPSDLVRSAP